MKERLTHPRKGEWDRKNGRERRANKRRERREIRAMLRQYR